MSLSSESIYRPSPFVVWGYPAVALISAIFVILFFWHQPLSHWWQWAIPEFLACAVLGFASIASLDHQVVFKELYVTFGFRSPTKVAYSDISEIDIITDFKHRSVTVKTKFGYNIFIDGTVISYFNDMVAELVYHTRLYNVTVIRNTKSNQDETIKVG